MKKKYKDKKNNSMKLISILLMTFVIFLTIGFSAFQDTLYIDNISAIVRAQADIRVTNITSSTSTSSAYSNLEEYNVSSINTSTALPNSNSTMTYDVEITNIGNVEMGILSITGLPSNLTYSISNYTLKDTLCDNTDSTQCKLGSITTLHITIGYTANGYNSSNTTYNLNMHFDFEPVYTITYSGFFDVTGLPTTILGGDTQAITFTNTTGIPAAVTTSNATGSYVSPTLTLSNVTGDVTITRNYSVTYVDFTGDTSGLISIIGPEGATITFNSTTGIPDNVSVSGAVGNYNSDTNVLIITNVTANVIVSVTTGNIQVVHDDENDTTTTIVTTENQDGSTSVVSTTVDDNTGVTLSETETTTNTDGSSTSTTTNYDSNGNETGSTTSETDTSGNTSTQETTVVNGSEVVTGYTIDTSNNSNGGLDVGNGSGVDTGVLALDGNPFTIHLVANVAINKSTSGTNGNGGKVVVSALEPTSSGATTYKGFAFFVEKSNNKLTLYASSSSAVQTGSQRATWGTKLNNCSVTASNSTYTQHTIDITYTPGSGNSNGTISLTLDGTTSSITSNTIPSSLSNATITIGTLGVTNSVDITAMEIIEFSVIKTVS